VLWLLSRIGLILWLINTIVLTMLWLINTISLTMLWLINAISLTMLWLINTIVLTMLWLIKGPRKAVVGTNSLQIFSKQQSISSTVRREETVYYSLVENFFRASIRL